MTRREQIEEWANEFTTQPELKEGLIEGAEWADRTPSPVHQNAFKTIEDLQQDLLRVMQERNVAQRKLVQTIDQLTVAVETLEFYAKGHDHSSELYHKSDCDRVAKIHEMNLPKLVYEGVSLVTHATKLQADNLKLWSGRLARQALAKIKGEKSESPEEFYRDNLP